MFPAWPMLPNRSPLREMDRIIAVDNGSGWMVFPVEDLRRELSVNSWLEVEGVVFSLGKAADRPESPKDEEDASPHGHL